MYLDAKDRKQVLLRKKISDDVADGKDSSDDDSDYDLGPSILKRAPSLDSRAEDISVDQVRSSTRFQALVSTLPIPLERCGVPAEKLFVFFDQTHSTGCHIGEPQRSIYIMSTSIDTCVFMIFYRASD